MANEPALVVQLIRVEPFLLRLQVPSGVMVNPGSCLLDGPAPTPSLLVERVEGESALPGTTDRSVLVWARLDRQPGHEFRMSSNEGAVGPS